MLLWLSILLLSKPRLFLIYNPDCSNILLITTCIHWCNMLYCYQSVFTKSSTIVHKWSSNHSLWQKSVEVFLSPIRLGLKPVWIIFISFERKLCNWLSLRIEEYLLKFFVIVNQVFPWHFQHYLHWFIVKYLCGKVNVHQITSCTM